MLFFLSMGLTHTENIIAKRQRVGKEEVVMA